MTDKSDQKATSPVDSLNALIATLAEREQIVLRLRFGLGGYSLTLREIGRVLKVTPERIRQIEAKSLRKLRHPTTT